MYGKEPRVKVANRKGPWQEVAITVHRLSEIDTPAFREFVKTAADSFAGQLRRMQQKPEDLMPWKLHGERWHLGDKGFPPGRKVLWDRGLLPRLLQLVREAAPGVEVQWDSRDAVTLRLPGTRKAWGRLKTKEVANLDCRFLGKPGQFNLARIEGVGVSPGVAGDRNDGGDVMKWQFVSADHFPAERIRALLTEHGRGFRETFGQSGAA